MVSFFTRYGQISGHYFSKRGTRLVLIRLSDNAITFNKQESDLIVNTDITTASSYLKKNCYSSKNSKNLKNNRPRASFTFTQLTREQHFHGKKKVCQLASGTDWHRLVSLLNISLSIIYHICITFLKATVNCGFQRGDSSDLVCTL